MDIVKENENIDKEVNEETEDPTYNQLVIGQEHVKEKYDGGDNLIKRQEETQDSKQGKKMEEEKLGKVQAAHERDSDTETSSRIVEEKAQVKDAGKSNSIAEVVLQTQVTGS